MSDLLARIIKTVAPPVVEITPVELDLSGFIPATDFYTNRRSSSRRTKPKSLERVTLAITLSKYEGQDSLRFIVWGPVADQLGWSVGQRVELLVHPKEGALVVRQSPTGLLKVRDATKADRVSRVGFQSVVKEGMGLKLEKRPMTDVTFQVVSEGGLEPFLLVELPEEFRA